MPLVFLAVRPLAAWIGLIVSGAGGTAAGNWSGGSGCATRAPCATIAFAITHGVSEPLAGELTRLTLTVVAASIVLHGISVTSTH